MGQGTKSQPQEENLLVDGILDTVIIVDLLRNYLPAVQWITSSNQSFGVTKFVWMEIVHGSDNKQNLYTATRLLERFVLVPIGYNKGS